MQSHWAIIIKMFVTIFEKHEKQIHKRHIIRTIYFQLINMVLVW